MDELEKILKEALAPEQYPPEKLQNKLLIRMEEDKMKKVSGKKLWVAAACILGLLVIPSSVFAGRRLVFYMENTSGESTLPEQALRDGRAEQMGTVEDGKYQVTFLGIVDEEKMNGITGGDWEFEPERTYAAVAVERTDGNAVTEEEDTGLMVSPMIQGYEPWKYNYLTMGGTYMGMIRSGVLYRVVDCSSFEPFADKILYLAVTDAPSYSLEEYIYQEKTGWITENKKYYGTNVLFDLPLDAGKADSAKADALIAGTNEEEKQQQELFEDEENDILIYVRKDSQGMRRWTNWSAADDQFIGENAVFEYYLNVQGEDIKSVKFELNNGEFCNFLDRDPNQLQPLGNVLQMGYEEQEQQDFRYCIYFTPELAEYGYDTDRLNRLWSEEKSWDEIDRNLYEILHQEIDSTVISLDIEKKDGQIVEKVLTLKDLSYQEEPGRFRVVIMVE